MRIDLHTHSDRSDGTESPTTLVESAQEEGIDVLALTDHDTADGWAEAVEASTRIGSTLVRGIEVSCTFEGQGVHLLAYLPDPSYPPLADELQRILDGRTRRLPATLDRLRALGIEITEADVRAESVEATALGRPHVADALVRLGVVADRDEAFERFLGPQGPAYVDRYAADLEEMITTVTAAGGASVVAHPWARRHDHSALDEAGFERLRDAGLAGAEVDHPDHDAGTREQLRPLVTRLGLVVTGSSDHHGLGKKGHGLGRDTTAPDQLDRLLARADEAARASGRDAPEVVRP